MSFHSCDLFFHVKRSVIYDAVLGMQHMHCCCSDRLYHSHV